MEKKIVIAQANLLDEYIAIMCMGVITCYEKGLLTYERVMLWLFNNRIIGFLKQSKSDSRVITALEYGEELWGVENTMLFENTINDIKNYCSDFLATTEIKRIGQEYLRFV